MALIFNFGTSIAPLIRALQRDGYIWSDTGIQYQPVTVNYFLDNTVKAWTQFETQAFHDAFQTWANVANISINQVTIEGEADLIELQVSTLTFDSENTLADHEYPKAGINQFSQIYGRFNYNAASWTEDGLQAGGRGFKTLVHELGHALGLAHSFNGPLGPFPGLSGYSSPSSHTGANGLSQMYWTVMSYAMTTDPETANVDKTASTTWKNEDLETEYSYGYAAGPMAFDIAAIQNYYGVNNNYRTGNDVYYLPDTDEPGTAYWTCIWDAGGSDAIVYTGSRDATINLRVATLDNTPSGGGYLSWADGIHGGFTIASGAHIEGAYGGSGNDTLTGNVFSNKIDGGAGADTMRGGDSDDIYEVDNPGDVVEENPFQGNADRVDSYISWTLGPNIENLVLYGDTDISGIGNELPNVFNGNLGNNSLYGLGGSDQIYGYGGHDKLDGGAGDDTMVGGPGNDIYEVDSINDHVTENPNEGTDRIDSYITWTLGPNFEDLVLYGSTDIHGIGNELPNAFNGNLGNNSLYGLGGSDQIYGYVGNDKLDGGLGDDTMVGGPDDDIYEVDSANDTVTENPNEGTDRVDSYISITLGPNVENLVLYGTPNVNGTGNELPNVLNGNLGHNTLKGLGGVDLIYGYTGNDTIEGGNEVDTAGYLGPRKDYLVHSKSVGGVLQTIVTDLGASGEGTDTLTGIEKLMFSDGSRAIAGAQQNNIANVDGDRFSDVLFQNDASGQVFYQKMVDGHAAGGTYLTNPLGTLRAAGSGHVDPAVGTAADVLVQDVASGTGVFGVGPGGIYYYSPQDAQPWHVVAWSLEDDGSADPNVRTTSWTLGAIADVNGDGTADAVIQSTNKGAIYYMPMINGAPGAWGVASYDLRLANTPTSDYLRFAAAGDVNADGFADVVVRNANDGTVYWGDMAGGTFTPPWHQMGAGPLGANYKVIGAGDLNGDGHADVIAQLQSQTANGLNGQTLWGDGAETNPLNAWKLVTNDASLRTGGNLVALQARDVVDLNNDGYADVVFQNSTTGDTKYWDMNPTTGGHFADIGTVPGWHVI